jgi:HAD superfamily hydrolase (TIGR01662 family)
MIPADTKLIIFDVDGTLADRDTNVLLPGVLDWFEQHGDEYDIALATNQGGVGLRWWMVKDGFGEPDKFPDQRDAENHVQAVINQLPERFRESLDLHAYICFAYQSKKSGKWSPVPEGHEDDWQWSPEYRKPARGMLVRAMGEFLVYPQETVMVGDSEEDEQAAQAAHCTFQNADEFFGRNQP